MIKITLETTPAMKAETLQIKADAAAKIIEANPESAGWETSITVRRNEIYVCAEKKNELGYTHRKERTISGNEDISIFEKMF